ncbi:MAG: PIN domain-containing protein [Bacteroidales bacterium]
MDESDSFFVALANHLQSKLWTGDKVLEKGLKVKGYSRIIITPELYEIFIAKEEKRKRLKSRRKTGGDYRSPDDLKCIPLQ